MDLVKSMNSSEEEVEVRPKEAAKRLKRSVPSVFRLMHSGELEHRTIRRRGVERGIRLITVESINRYMAEHSSKDFWKRPVSQAQEVA